ncbi:hypothetical protein AC579_5883 [Pseudocercospora musae]|uniref:Transposase IS30-like HTH domain-containing protein n=1 Tax=Pseudocercospora musae TaxID=113226 RepID=A0A139ITF6_9PEZI|nr:hypothetical protein AC579_5883 [Pseudocercospora musae]
MLYLLGTRGWHARTCAVTRCARFHVNAVAKAAKATQRPESSKLKPKPGVVAPTPWTAKDLQNLKQMYEKGIQRRDIAKRLGRSRAAVTARIFHARETQKWTPTVQRWDEIQEKKLLALRDQGKTFVEIGRILGRPGRNVSNKFRQLRPGTTGARKWTNEEHEIASKLHSKGYSVRQIARELKRTPRTVKYYQLLGNQYRPKTSDEEFEMFEMHEAGFATCAIADKLGRRPNTVRSWLEPKPKPVNMRRFTPSEDARLLQLRTSRKSWKEVRDAMGPDRNTLQLRARFYRLISGK